MKGNRFSFVPLAKAAKALLERQEPKQSQHTRRTKQRRNTPYYGYTEKNTIKHRQDIQVPQNDL